MTAHAEPFAVLPAPPKPETATTGANLREINAMVTGLCPAPILPDGPGWQLRCAVVHENRVLWFWQR